MNLEHVPRSRHHPYPLHQTSKQKNQNPQVYHCQPSKVHLEKMRSRVDSGTKFTVKSRPRTRQLISTNTTLFTQSQNKIKLYTNLGKI